ncbi:MAG: protein translocase subunit SecD [Spirochaetales bacterium]|nr:protein translocase subunit SecD [Spirochaetales bacterium]
MSKRFRFVIILVLLGVAAFFLYPTFKWYVQLDETKRELSSSSNAQVKVYAQNRAREAIDELRELLLKPYTVSNLKNPEMLLTKLKKGEEPLYAFLKEKLSDQGRALVSGYEAEKKVTEGMKEDFVSELNRIIRDGLFYDEEAFEDFELTKRVRDKAEEYASSEKEYPDGYFIIINRSIFEEVFQREIVDIPLPKEYGFLKKNIDLYYKSIKKSGPPVATVTSAFKCFLRRADMMTAIEDHYHNEITALKETRRGTVQLGLDLMGGMKITIRANFEEMAKDRGEPISTEQREDAMKRVLEILNNRIDQFGVTEPQIRRQGEERIIIELPGVADPERIRGVIRGKGRLNFHIVDKEATDKLREYIEKSGGNFRLDTESLRAQGIIPAGTVAREVVKKDKYGNDETEGYAVIQEAIGLSGNYIEDAQVQRDPTMLRPIVTFNLSSEGGERFYKLTSDNEKETLAILLDDKIKFQATIEEPIRDRVQVRGQGITVEEAQDLALVLRTGALPVPLEIIAQEAVGASLGEDSINQGLNAILLGVILVIGFMLVYYKGGGIVADVALCLNFFLMAAALSVLNFTLTLPSIAGFILTIGMSVDANVIIFERIKEEYKIGKSRKAAVSTGFSKAFLTIVDANITTFIAAVVLAYFGKGPIQGFAWVLAIGIVCSMITALFVARLMFDFITDVFKAKRLSLGWRVSK